jgi:Zn-finger nucleic acid-binding protein
MSAEACPRCCAHLKTKQVNNLLSKYCDRCGSLPFATNVKTGRGVIVDRSGLPIADEVSA